MPKVSGLAIGPLAATPNWRCGRGLTEIVRAWGVHMCTVAQRRDFGKSMWKDKLIDVFKRTVARYLCHGGNSELRASSTSAMGPGRVKTTWARPRAPKTTPG